MQCPTCSDSCRLVHQQVTIGERFWDDGLLPLQPRTLVDTFACGARRTRVEVVRLTAAEWTDESLRSACGIDPSIRGFGLGPAQSD